jgi:hypothetical protein
VEIVGFIFLIIVVVEVEKYLWTPTPKKINQTNKQKPAIMKM